MFFYTMTIPSLPAELSYNKKLQNLDLGKVKRLLPNLHIFNARPIDKSIKNKMGESVDIASRNVAYKEDIHREEKKDQKRNPKFQVSVEKQDDTLDSAAGLDAEKELKRKRKKGNDKLSTEVPVDEEEDIIVEKEEKKKKKEEVSWLKRNQRRKN